MLISYGQMPKIKGKNKSRSIDDFIWKAARLLKGETLLSDDKLLEYRYTNIVKDQFFFDFNLKYKNCSPFCAKKPKIF